MAVVNGSVMLQSMREGGMERDKGRDSEGGEGKGREMYAEKGRD